MSPRRAEPASAPPPPRPAAAAPDRRGVGGWLRGAFSDHLGLKLVSLLLALTVYLLINTDEQREIRARMPVAYVLPPDKALVSERVDEVVVTVRGPWRRIKRFDEREVDRIDLDLRDVAGGEVTITPAMIDLPRGLEVAGIEPSAIRVAFEDVATRTVPVRPALAGRPLHGYHVDQARTLPEPSMVTVRGAAGVVRALDAIATQEVRVDGRGEHFVATVGVVAPPDTVITDHREVSVAVAIDQELVTRRLGVLPVALRGGDGRWAVAPGEVEVTLTGYLLAVEAWIDRGVTPEVVPPSDGAGRGGRLPVAVPGGPPGVGVEITPAVVAVTPRK